jgi:hypothetical protein
MTRGVGENYCYYRPIMVVPRDSQGKGLGELAKNQVTIDRYLDPTGIQVDNLPNAIQATGAATHWVLCYCDSGKSLLP